jgi:hypothetical protein
MTHDSSIEFPARNLSELFYRSFDHSLALSMIAKFGTSSTAQMRSHPLFLGEGSHFLTFRMQTSPLPLVLKIAKNSTINNTLSLPKNWRQHMSRLKSIQSPLIPPFELIDVASNYALAMPEGKPLRFSTTLAQPLNDMLQGLAITLRRAGLELNDYPQLVAVQDQFFVHDWSDLQAVS